MTTKTSHYTCDEEISLAIQAYHGDNQFQSSKPIGKQPPLPGGIFDMLLSWDRHRSYMRLEIPELDGTWHFKKLQGQVQITGTDNERGRILLHGQARLDGEVLSIYRAPASTPIRPWTPRISPWSFRRPIHGSAITGRNIYGEYGMSA